MSQLPSPASLLVPEARFFPSKWVRDEHSHFEVERKAAPTLRETINESFRQMFVATDASFSSTSSSSSSSSSSVSPSSLLMMSSATNADMVQFARNHREAVCDLAEKCLTMPRPQQWTAAQKKSSGKPGDDDHDQRKDDSDEINRGGGVDGKDEQPQQQQQPPASFFPFFYRIDDPDAPVTVKHVADNAQQLQLQLQSSKSADMQPRRRAQNDVADPAQRNHHYASLAILASAIHLFQRQTLRQRSATAAAAAAAFGDSNGKQSASSSSSMAFASSKNVFVHIDEALISVLPFAPHRKKAILTAEIALAAAASQSLRKEARRRRRQRGDDDDGRNSGDNDEKDVVGSASYSDSDYDDDDDDDDDDLLLNGSSGNAPSSCDLTTVRTLVNFILRTRCHYDASGAIVFDDDDGETPFIGRQLLIAFLSSGFELPSKQLQTPPQQPLAHLQETANKLIACFSFRETSAAAGAAAADTATSARFSLQMPTSTNNSNINVLLDSNRMTICEIAFTVVIAAFVLGTAPQSDATATLRLSADNSGDDSNQRGGAAAAAASAKQQQKNKKKDQNDDFHTAILDCVSTLCKAAANNKQGKRSLQKQRKKPDELFARESRIVPALHLLVRFWSPVLALQRETWKTVNHVRAAAVTSKSTSRSSRTVQLPPNAMDTPASSVEDSSVDFVRQLLNGEDDDDVDVRGAEEGNVDADEEILSIRMTPFSQHGLCRFASAPLVSSVVVVPPVVAKRTHRKKQNAAASEKDRGGATNLNVVLGTERTMKMEIAEFGGADEDDAMKELLKHYWK